ncbi:MAG: zinc ribbon domain-containing protein [Chloroflexi bacterium]|nr:zinc ribbon domain-containing protein [Chloroflexota bacterium]
MPLYEYICGSCNKRVTVFLRTASAAANPCCPVCGNNGLTRIISSFAIHKSIQTIHEESGTPGQAVSPDYYKDPRNIGRHLEKRLQDSNIEIPPDIRKSIDEAREGNLPASLKDLDSAAADSAYH